MLRSAMFQGERVDATTIVRYLELEVTPAPIDRDFNVTRPSMTYSIQYGFFCDRGDLLRCFGLENTGSAPGPERHVSVANVSDLEKEVSKAALNTSVSYFGRPKPDYCESCIFDDSIHTLENECEPLLEWRVTGYLLFSH